jgi:hypothetical protein
METIERKDVQERFDRITEIFSDMVTKAQKSSLRRCPYKNRFSECTAKFQCALQGAAPGERGLLPCLGDDKFGYCEAWTDQPLKGE